MVPPNYVIASVQDEGIKMPLHGKPVAFVSTADADRAIIFYRDKLGLPMVSRDDFGMFFALDGGLLRLTPIPEFQPGLFPVAGWEVADIDESARFLRSAGIDLIHYAGMGQAESGIWTSPDALVKVAWFADPDGNLLSLSQSGL